MHIVTHSDLVIYMKLHEYLGGLSQLEANPTFNPSYSLNLCPHKYSQARPQRYTHIPPHAHPYTRSMQICKIVERGYQIMNPLPTIAGR